MYSCACTCICMCIEQVHVLNTFTCVYVVLVLLYRGRETICYSKVVNYYVFLTREPIVYSQLFTLVDILLL